MIWSHLCCHRVIIVRLEWSALLTSRRATRCLVRRNQLVVLVCNYIPYCRILRQEVRQRVGQATRAWLSTRKYSALALLYYIHWNAWSVSKSWMRNAVYHICKISDLRSNSSLPSSIIRATSMILPHLASILVQFAAVLKLGGSRNVVWGRAVPKVGPGEGVSKGECLACHS